jgi:hypothetical protein
MARYKSKAEKNFETRFKQALMWRDWRAMEGLLIQYGAYLELVDDYPDGGGLDEEDWTTLDRYFYFIPAKTDYSHLPEWHMPEFQRESTINADRAALAHEANDVKMAFWQDIYDTESTGI